MLLARVERIDKSNEIIGAGDDHGVGTFELCIDRRRLVFCNETQVANTSGSAMFRALLATLSFLVILVLPRRARPEHAGDARQ